MSIDFQIPDVLSGKATAINLPGVTDFKFNTFSGIIHRLFSELDIPFMSEAILVVLRELILNASKANSKRVYFIENNLNINDTREYQKGILEFSSMIKSDFQQFAQAHKDSDYYIKIFFHKTESSIQIAVENNSAPTQEEAKRINERFEYFKKISDLERAFTDMKDEMEGSGLGILLSLMLLKRSGIPTENFSFKSDGEITRVIITVPLNLRPHAFRATIRDNILSRIASLPSLPERINHLLSLFDSENASLQKISREIEMEPGITAQILKLVYSAGYVSRFKDPSIFDAVKIIGLNVIRNLLLVTGSRSTLATRFHSNELENIWENSNCVSYFVRRLSTGDRKLEDIGPVAGLLHELGRIVLISMEPTLIRQINDLLGGERIRQTSVIEEIELGISHPEIGALLAEKWNFPEALRIAIGYQQKPLQAPAEYKNLIYAVYLAICIQDTVKNRCDYYSIEPEVLNSFNIRSAEEFMKRVDAFSQDYEKMILETEQDI